MRESRAMAWCPDPLQGIKIEWTRRAGDMKLMGVRRYGIVSFTLVISSISTLSTESGTLIYTISYRPDLQNW
jgi:hypothetical protein